MGKLTYEEWEAEGEKMQAVIDRARKGFDGAIARGDRVAVGRFYGEIRQLGIKLKDHMKIEPPPTR